MCVSDVPLATFLAWTEPGDDDWSWRSQFKWLEKNHLQELMELRQNLAMRGQKFPIYVGEDGRLWNGHHRVWCAVDLGWPSIKVDVPCENCEDRNERGKAGLVRGSPPRSR